MSLHVPALHTPSSSDATAVDSHPHTRPTRRLILCFDGTANLYADANTNVVKLVSFFKKDDHARQMVYYQTGVGTYIKPGFAMPFTVRLMKVLDQCVGFDIGNHIMGGYEFLMQNWVPGDKICLFGFSRGAYTARAVAGMLHKVGLLPRGNSEQIPFAYQMYKRQDDAGMRMSAGFKKTFSNEVDVEFLGVWDTVSSVGVLTDQYLPFTASDYHIKVFRHALALDERRCKFQANHWHKALPPPSNTRTNSRSRKNTSSVTNTTRGNSPTRMEYYSSQMSLNEDGDFWVADTAKNVTDVEEVWFAGCHGDVGGGYVEDTLGNDMARIPLTWMLREIALHSGIVFDSAALAEASIDLSTLPRPIDSTLPAPVKQQQMLVRPPVVELNKRYAQDASSPLHDQLKLVRGWWILEIIPFIYRLQEQDGKWKNTLRVNLGRPRLVPPPIPIPVKVHISVKERMDRDGKYKPAPKWEGEPEWVH